ncbi:MAG: hypothetical protein GX945_02170 [Lentisphaerae bacterium]|nr:hypothetical protein [Lentisphaerota bacterium]
MDEEDVLCEKYRQQYDLGEPGCNAPAYLFGKYGGKTNPFPGRSKKRRQDQGLFYPQMSQIIADSF